MQKASVYIICGRLNKVNYFVKSSMKYFLQNHFRILILAITPLFLSACGSGEVKCNYGVAHTYIPAVILAAADTNGNKLTNFVIAYLANSGSGSKTLTCNSADGCDLEFFGKGDLDITVSKDGYQSVSLKTSIQVIGNCGETNIERLSVKLKPI